MRAIDPGKRLVPAALVLLVVAALVMPIAASSADVPIATVASGAGPASLAIDPVAGRVYVANYNGGSAGVIDAGTASLVATVSMGGSTFPDCVVANPLSSPPRAYVGNFWTGTVKVIDGSSLTVTATLASGGSHGGGPRALALDPAGTTPKLFVADYGTDTCSVFNAETHALIARIPVGSVPRALGIFVSAGRRRVFVANRGDATVSIIDAATDSVVATVPTGTKPKAIAVDDSTGFAYVTNEDSDTVTIIDANDEVTATVAVGDRPIGVAVDPVAGRVFVADFNSNDIAVIRTSDLTLEATVAAGVNPWGVAVDVGRSMAYVTNYGSASVSIVASDLAVATCPAGVGPYAVAVDESVYPHRVYVTNWGTGDLTVIADDGLGLGVVAPAVAYAAPSGPVAVAIQPLPGDATLSTGVTLTGTAQCVRPIPAAVAVVFVRVDGGLWQRAALTSGSGTPAVEWSATLAGLATGSHTVEALAFDETGAASATSEMGSGAKSVSGGGSSLYRFAVNEWRGFSGTLTDGADPLPGMIVDAYRVVGTSLVRTKYTAVRSDGTWALRDLPTGDYKLRAYDPAKVYRLEWYDDVATAAGAQVFALAAGSRYQGLEFALSRQTLLAGTVTDGSDPLSGTIVDAYRAEGATLTRTAKAVVGADGGWSIKDLPPGEYKLRISDGSGVWKTEWYDDAAADAGAATLTLGPGTRIEGLSTVLVQPNEISGTVSDGLNPLPGTIVDAYRVVGTTLIRTKYTSVRADGTWVIRDLPGGDYKIRVADPAKVYRTEWYDDVSTQVGAQVFTVGAGSRFSGLSVLLSR